VISSQAKTLVVNADDFGLSESIDRGILSAHQNGIVRSASLMPNGQAFEDAVRIAIETPSLGVGVHLSLVDQICVAPPGELRSMVGEDGSLPASYIVFARQFMAKRFGTREVRIEIGSQIEKVLSAGIHPTHIDSHQHLHMLPGIFNIVVESAIGAGIPAIRIPLERGGPAETTCARPTLVRSLQTWMLARICRARLDQVRKAGLHTADWFWGLGVSGRMNEANLMTVLQDLRPGVNEIMCHPGISDSATAERYEGWGYSWEDELAAMTSGSVRRFIDDNDIRPCSFADAWS
jgi:chitin disaccharide deacetylase